MMASIPSMNPMEPALELCRGGWSGPTIRTVLKDGEYPEYVELSSRSPLAERESLTAAKLRGIPCILVASPAQRENEQTYYRDIVGIQGEFLFAENLEEARMLVIGGKGYLPVEGAPRSHSQAATCRRIPLLRDGRPILRNYCAFWKVGSQNPYVEDFADILQKQFN